MEINGYQLSRSWFDFCFDNPEKINPTHTAIFFFAIEHCNRLGWKEKFGFPTQMTMDALGIKKHQTYIKYFNDLCEWGFFNLVQRSKNQYSANIISLSNALPKNGRALDKAFIKHAAKQTESNGQSTGQSKDSIDKQLTINQEQENKGTNSGAADAARAQKSLEEREKEFMERVAAHLDTYPKEMLRSFYDYWTEKNEGGRRMKFEMQRVFDVSRRLATWKRNEQNKPYGNSKKRESTADLMAGIQQRIMRDAQNGGLGGGF